MKTIHHEKIKQDGHRMTQARSSIIELLESTPSPISAKGLHTMLERIGVHVNVTTVYRELDFLLEQNIIEKVPLKDSEVLYEMKGRPHHHHLLCTKCGDIQDISLESEHVLLEEARQSSAYQIKAHALAFYGYCKRCQ